MKDLHNLHKMTMKTVTSPYETVQHYAFAPFIAAGLVTLLIIGTAYHLVNHVGNKNGSNDKQPLSVE